MVATHDLIGVYLTRLRDLAGETDHIQRFYLFLTDDRLYGWEYELSNSDQAEAFYDQLIEQYRAWKDSMSAEQWAEVVDYNDALNGANQNALIDDL